MVDTMSVNSATKSLQFEVKTPGGTTYTGTQQAISISPGSHYWCPGGGAAKTYNSVNIIAYK